PPAPKLAANAPRGWRANPIDRFVYAKLAEADLAPNTPADRVTLLRRVTYDLTGLPPTPGEAAAFLADDSPDAYEKVVDRLLASPRYGERWGRHWLDVVRFGESVGFEQNYILDNAWPFRDYVIDSFNADKPFDRFITEHLAGDVVGKGDPSAEIGTAFLVVGPWDTVGNQDAVQKAQIRANTLDEIIRATGEAFLGVTIGCARCHDHKFDPIRQEDYYQMYATFAGVKHASRVVATDAQRKARAEVVGPLDKELKALTAERIRLEKAIAQRGADQREQIEATWTRPVVSRYGTEERFAPVEAKFVRLTVWRRDDNFKGRGGYRVDEFEVFDTEGRNVALAKNGGVARGKSRIAEDFEGAYDVSLVIDGKFGKRWIGDTPELTIELAKPTVIDRVFFSSDRNRAIAIDGKITVFAADYRLHVSSDGETWREVAHSYDRKPLNEKHAVERLFDHVETKEDRARRAELARVIQKVEAQIKKAPKLPNWWAGQFENVEGAQRVFLGGSPQNLGDAVTPASLWTLGEVMRGYQLPADAPESERRMALARWVVAPDNPLTPRVLANRLWHYHFGTGIVDTPSDLGFMGGRPTHPELLEWLARRLVDAGWRLKPMHKLIVTSAAYRQASTWREDAAGVDADTRLLWRFPPRRLSGEELRDTFLAAAGKLDHAAERGGPGFRLYHYFRDNVSTYIPLDEHNESTYRRAVYHQNARGQLVDLMTEFDCPDPTAAAPRRVATTTPLQALTLLNHSFTMDMAEALATRVQTADDPVTQVFELLFTRKPSREEKQQAQQVAHAHGLPALCRTLLNTNALMYLD
ncbi:MAG: DUF1553 domain-containing protein, partial [Planctomycetota bacterium]